MQHYLVNLVYVLTLFTPHRTAASPLGALRVPHVVAAQRLFTHDEMSYFAYKPKDTLHSAYTEDELEWAWGHAAGHTKGKGDAENSWRSPSHVEALMSDIEVWA